MHHYPEDGKYLRQWLIFMAGDACQECKSVEDLTFHHTKRNYILSCPDKYKWKKRFEMTSWEIIQYPWEEVIDEWYGCALLCRECHDKLHDTSRNARTIRNRFFLRELSIRGPVV